jgi:poly(3-hydroxybutyrate) depolymerase
MSWGRCIAWSALGPLALAFACGTSSTPPGSLADSSGALGGTASGSSGASSGAGGAAVSGTLSGTGTAEGSSGLPFSGSVSGTAAGATTASGAGASGATTDSGERPDSMAAGDAMTMAFPSGPSPGCGTAPPAGLNSTHLALQNLSVPSCTGSAVTPECVASAFQMGGSAYLKVDQWDYNHRNYGLELPPNYDPTKKYPVILEGGGCTGGPTDNGGGYTAGETNAIRVGLSYVGQCFADGGVQCSVTVANEPLCVNNPEVTYISALLADIESKLCVDLGQVFIGGYSSGAWEASTIGCALSNVIRGTAGIFGGERINHPVCPAPMASILVVGDQDNENPIGPLVMNMPDTSAGLTAQQVNNDIQQLDSNGSAPERDWLLMRNGCQGNATAPYDPAYPGCVKYTGCPSAYPVVWCELPIGHGGGNVTSGGVNYVPGSSNNPLFWTFLTKLSAP